MIPSCKRTPASPPEILQIPERAYRPLWSVMIPAFNCAVFLTEAIKSVLVQDRGENLMQIEVVDDFSTDTDVEKLVQEIGKGRVSYYRQKENVGSLRNFETCINRSMGKYIHLLHGDDSVVNGFYEQIESLFNQFPQAGAAFTNFSYIDDNGLITSLFNSKLKEEPGIIDDFLYKIALKQLIQPPAIVVKREVYEKLGSFYAVHFGEDWEMWARIAAHYELAYSPNTLANYRVANPHSISYNSFLTGKNIDDILKVIYIIQGYLPERTRKEVKNAALTYYSIYCVKVANSLLLKNKKAAFIQAKGAFRMHKNLITTYWVCRFYLMYLFRYKQLEKFKNQVWPKHKLPQ